MPPKNPFHTLYYTLFIVLCFWAISSLQSCHDDDSPCKNSTCPPHSQCVVDVAGNASCACDLGYIKSGDTCKYAPCTITDCFNGGVCEEDSLTHEAHCLCPPEYMGEHCEKFNPCYGFPCGEHGVCAVDSSGLPYCDCEEGYTGADCHPDPCSNIICPNNASCTDGICNCLLGYTNDLNGDSTPDGDTCVQKRARLIGNYLAVQACSFAATPADYSVTITPDPDNVQKIIINNLHNAGNDFEVEAFTSTTISFYILQQNFANNTYIATTNNAFISLSDSTITISYKIITLTDTTTCEGLHLVRQ